MTDFTDTRLIRTFLESPILDERKWAKAEQLPADALLVDLEDSVPPDRKEEARERAVKVLAESGKRGDQFLVPRINSLSSQHCDDDIAAVSRTAAPLVAYPKLQSRGELREVLDKFAGHGKSPGIFASIESASGVQAVDEIAADPNVVGLLLGSADLGLDMGMPIQEAKDLSSPALRYARSRVVTAAAANNLACITMAFPKRMTDLDETRTQIYEAQRLGFTGMMTFYPPHLDLINAAFTPDDAEVKRAQEAVDVYTEARADGRASAYLSSGDLVLAFDFEYANTILHRHRVLQKS
ncbi:HpcH/HpaI aldolase/citrate lyase family protein [Rhodococcus koreensis]|uniref:HpcH/HpaI aldolase/citrate lyase family protein n=1 Tax=Rhodococcus koreensis TaxID=99653 RepID=UPI003670505A